MPNLDTPISPLPAHPLEVEQELRQFNSDNTYIPLRQPQDMGEDTFVCDDCGEEFHVSEER